MSYYLEAGVTFEDAYKLILRNILTKGRTRDVRGFKTLELSPFCWTTLNPLENVLTNPVRKINRAFQVAEWLWMMTGRNDVEMVSYYNKNIAKFSQDGKVFTGAYGPRIREQINYVLSSLKADPGCRQAIINIWTPNPKKDKDIPCTLTMQFLISHGTLDLIVNMRSNDAWLGLPYDFYNFTMIQNYVSFKLGLRIGRYTHLAASEHLYEEHIEKAAKVSEMSTFQRDVRSTELIQHDELALLANVEDLLRHGENNHKLIEDLHEPWKSMALELEAYCKNKCVQT